MENELFDTSIYNSTASVDNTTPPNTPAEKRKEDIIAADNASSDVTLPWLQGGGKIKNALNDFIAGKTTSDELISVVNAAADTVITAVNDIKGQVFIKIVEYTDGHLAGISYQQFVRKNPNRRKFIGKSDYYALRNFYERRERLPDDIKLYLTKSSLTNAKIALNMKDYNRDNLCKIMERYPDGIPGKKEFGKLLLPPPPKKITKPKGKPRCMSLRNIKYVYQATGKNTNRILNSLEVHHSADGKIQVLRQKYDEFNTEITAILAELEQSAKRTITAKSRKEEALI